MSAGSSARGNNCRFLLPVPGRASEAIKGTLHSKITISDLVDLFRRVRWQKFEVINRSGRRSNKWTRMSKKYHAAG